LIGIHADALAHSIGGGNAADASSCSSLGDSRWRCRIVEPDPSSSRGVSYLVSEASFGCWTAARIRTNGRARPVRPADRKAGCIDIADVVGGL
jgi:hypothetical protein